MGGPYREMDRWQRQESGDILPTALPELANKNRGCPVQQEFQTNDEQFFTTCPKYCMCLLFYVATCFPGIMLPDGHGVSGMSLASEEKYRQACQQCQQSRLKGLQDAEDIPRPHALALCHLCGNWIFQSAISLRTGN